MTYGEWIAIYFTDWSISMSDALNSAISTLHINLKSLRSFVGLVHPYLKEQAIKRAKDNARDLIPFMVAMNFSFR